MYNFRFKKFQNGTFQLTYYSNVILTKDDRYKPKKFSEENEGAELDNEMSNRYLDNPFITENDVVIPAGYSDKDVGWLLWKEKYSVSDLTEKDEGAELELDELSENELALKKDRSLKSSMNRSKRKIYDYGRANVWEWFFTFTFKPVKEFNRENFEDCKKKVTKWFKNIRNSYCKNIKYLIVPEQHKSGAWHFHALVSNCEGLTFTHAINQRRFMKDDEGNIVYNKKGQPIPNKYYGCLLRTSYPDGDYIYNIEQYKSGFTTATKINDTKKAVSYIVKYITKDLSECTFGKRRYLPSNNLNVPEVEYAFRDPKMLDDIIHNISYMYNVDLSINCVKTYKIEVENYENTITVFEFNPKDNNFIEERCITSV